MRRGAAAGNGGADVVNGGAQCQGPLNEVFGDGGPSGNFPQPFRRAGRQRIRVVQPIDDVRRVAQMVLMRLIAATRFRVGEIESEIAADKRQRTGSR